MLDKWFGTYAETIDVVTDNVSVTFESDNNSTKLPYSILINCQNTGHAIVFDAKIGKWYLKVCQADDISQENLQDILAKIEYLNSLVV